MATKLCRYCKQWKPIEQFETAGIIKGKRYYRHKCQGCKNTDVRRRRREKADWLRKKKQESSCENCGNSDHRVLEFHHKDPTGKDFNVSEMIHSHSLENIKREIVKCQILCANCHRIVHYNEAWASG